MGRWVGLGEVVSKVVSARTPEDNVVAEVNTVANPVVPHVDRLGPLEADRTVSDTQGGGVVGDPVPDVVYRSAPV